MIGLTISAHALEKLEEIGLPLKSSDVIRLVSDDILRLSVGHSGKGWLRLIKFKRNFQYWRPCKAEQKWNNTRSYQRDLEKVKEIDGIWYELCEGDAFWAIVDVTPNEVYVKTFLVRESFRTPHYPGEWYERA